MAAPAASVMAAAANGHGDPSILSGAPIDPDDNQIDEYSNVGCGTSFAAPHVAGVAALLFSYAERPGVTVATRYQNLDPAGVWQILCLTADDLGDQSLYGAGRLNAYRALLELRGQPNLPGDLDGDGAVTSLDARVIWHWLAGSGPGSSPTCLMDMNLDGVIDNRDYKAIDSYVKSGYPDLLIPSTCF